MSREQVGFILLYVAMLLVVSWGSMIVWERRNTLPAPIVVTSFVLIASTILVFLNSGEF